MGVSEDRRRQLAQAAYELVAEAGIEKLSLRTVARRVDATTGLLSHHFLDRQDLLSAALDHAAATMFERILGVPDGSDPLALLAAVLPTDEPAQQVWRFSLSVRAAGLFEPELRQFDQTIRSYWDDNLPDRLRSVPPADREEAAQHLVLLVDGIALRAVLDPVAWPPARQLTHLRAGFLAIASGDLDGARASTTAAGAGR
jgi:TetR/AcrR family transcriptional regulator, transcriptional repressor of bet genes